VVSLKAQQTDDNSASPETFADLAGTSISFAHDDDNQIAILEIEQPRGRYIRPVVVRSGGDTVIDGVIAVQTKADSEPVTHDTSTVSSAEIHVAPAEGVA